MIRVHTVELLNWDVQPHQKLVLADGVTLLTGENGSGKTSVLDAIKVALGVTRLDAGRTIEGYLGKQAAPVAMVRLLLDNRRNVDSRRRPLDRLQPGFGDLVTLAVVFRSDGEKSWNHDYFVLDGDVVPLGARPAGKRTGADGPRPLPGIGTYRQNLKALGVGDQYRKLLELGQGKMARLCELDGNKLFDTLFDIIGGRDTLDEWDALRRKLQERRLEREGVEKDLRSHRETVRQLGERKERHERWRQVETDITALDRALPHAHLAAAEAKVRESGANLDRAQQDRSRLERSLATGRERLVALDADLARAEEDRGQRERERGETAEQLSDARRAHEASIAALAVLDATRKAGADVPAEDLGQLHGERDDRQVELSAGRRDANDRAGRRAQVDAELGQLAQGLLPWPAEVETFREILRLAGLPHHLLAEIVEVADEAWTPALEGFLGPLRLAIVVHDPDSFDRAAALAREHHYPHGVLAPDVRGRSPDDDEGLLPLVTVREPRFRPLLARLLRRLQPGDPPRPYQPPREGPWLAQDGFLLERLVARHAGVERAYLGREALQQRQRLLEEERRALDEADAHWLVDEKRLRARVVALEEAIRRQEARLRWEDVRDEHAQAQVAVADLRAEVERLEERVRLADKALSDLSSHATELRKDRETVSRDLAKDGRDRDAAEARLGDHQEAYRQAQAALGQLQALALPDRDAAIEAVLADSPTVDILEARVREKRQSTSAFSPADRDPLVPLHFTRQSEELVAVERRLAEVHDHIDQTAKAAEEAHEQYQQTTKRVFRAYFSRLAESGRDLEYGIDGRLEPRDDGRFRCDVRVAVSDKAAVHHDSEELSGGQKAALSTLMAMTAVALDEDEGPGFFLIDEPFAASDVGKINELGNFLHRTGARYILSMPTSADLAQCGSWLQAVWTCTRSRGGFDAQGRVVLAPAVKHMFTVEALDGR